MDNASPRHNASTKIRRHTNLIFTRLDCRALLRRQTLLKKTKNKNQCVHEIQPLFIALTYRPVSKKVIRNRRDV